MIDESRVQIDEARQAEGDSVRYYFDFGYNWQHEIVLEKILPLPAVSPIPKCRAGEQHRPPIMWEGRANRQSCVSR